MTCSWRTSTLMRWSADSRPELDLCGKFMLLLQKTTVLSIQLMEFSKIRLTVMQCAVSLVSFRAQSPPVFFSSFFFSVVTSETPLFWLGFLPQASVSLLGFDCTRVAWLSVFLHLLAEKQSLLSPVIFSHRLRPNLGLNPYLNWDCGIDWQRLSPTAAWIRTVALF